MFVLVSAQICLFVVQYPLPKELKNKLAFSCGVERNSVIECLDAKTIYQVPLSFLKENILVPISEALDLVI